MTKQAYEILHYFVDRMLFVGAAILILFVLFCFYLFLFWVGRRLYKHIVGDRKHE